MNVAIVGCGRAGTQHADAIAAAGGRVAAVCDADGDCARRMSEAAHAPVRPLPELLDDPTVEVVSVCSPPDTHVPLALGALGAGKAVIVEKPPALSPEGVAQLTSAAQEHERPLAVMLQHRGRLPDEALETPWSAETSATVEVFRHRPAAHYADGTWRGEAARAGGGFFAHLAIHYSDLACQVLGDPEHVHASVDVGELAGIDVRATLSVRMASAARLTIHASALPGARQERLHVLDGTRELTVTNDETRYVDHGRESVVPAPPTPELRAAVYREVEAALRESRPVRRYDAATASGAVGLLSHVIDATVTAAR